MNQSTVVEDYEFIIPDNDELDYLVHKIFKDCRETFFHSFEYRDVYDNNFTNSTNNEKVNLPISFGFIEFKFEYYVLIKNWEPKMQETMVLISMN